MNKLCENCPYNGPYWSIVNPCENCPNNGFPINKTATITTTVNVGTLQITYGENTGDIFVTGLSTDLPSADEYRNSIGARYYYQREWSEPKYICPKCGGGMCKHENIVFCSNPPKYEYKCNKCGHVEYQLG